MNTILALAAFALATPLAHPSQAPGSVNLHQVALDVAKIKPLLPVGMEIAGAYTRDFDQQNNPIAKTLTGDDYLNSVAGSYLFADLRHSGKKDLAVAIEAAPTVENNFPTFGARALLIYLTDASGNLHLFTQGKVVLGYDDGGVFGDPFDSLTLNAAGSLEVNHYGGSADRWGYTQVFMWRHNDFYHVGETDTAYNDLDLKGQIEETNLLTGQEIVTIMRGQNLPDRVVHKHVAVKPLVKLSATVLAN